MESEAKRIAESFGKQWAMFDYGRCRTWGASVDERLENFISDVGKPREWYTGKRVLDAGCGPGTLTYGISTLGCETVGIDISASVEEAQRRFQTVTFIRADISSPPSNLGSFDLIYSGGVLHHTANTRRALEALLTLLRPRGIVYVWLYWHVSGSAYAAKYALRRLVRPLPYHYRKLPAIPFAIQGFVRNRGLSFGEHLITQHDFFTPRYRWEHTPDEVTGWFRDLGLHATIRATSRNGFGILAERA
jgi:SAM-dependent methyltransferase